MLLYCIDFGYIIVPVFFLFFNSERIKAACRNYVGVFFGTGKLLFQDLVKPFDRQKHTASARVA